MKKRILFVFVTLLISSSKLFASGGGCTGTEIPCSSANPFCSTISYNFPNETSTCVPSGPNYGCLASQPNPVWYYMQINQSGNIQLDLEQTTGPNGTGSGLDVDFALYGPYSSLNAGCSAIDGGDFPLQCSFSAAPTETIGLGLTGGAGSGESTPSSAVVGQFYIVLITNYDGASGYISFNQSVGSTGSADCSIVTPCDISSVTATPSSCDGSGNYSVSGTISFVTPPATGTLTVTTSCGGIETFSAPFNSPQNYSIIGLTGNGGGCTVTATFSDDATCTKDQTFTAPTCGCAVTAGNSGPVCEGSTFGLTASNVTGATSYTWSGPGSFSSSTQNPTGLVAPSTAGTYTYTLTVNSSSGSCSNTTTLVVDDLPVLTLNPQTVCSPATVDLTSGAVASTTIGALTYYTDVALTSPVASPGAVAAGTYFINATNGTCNANGSLLVTINTTPTLTVADQTVCSPATVDLTNASVSSTDVGAISYYSDPALTTLLSSPNSVGNGSYYAQADNAGCLASGTINVTVDALPVLTLNDQTVCSPSTVDLTSTSVVNSSVGVVSFYSDPTLSTVVFSPSSVGAGTYYIESVNGTCSVNGSLTVSVTTTPTLSLTSQLACSPATIDLTSSSVASSNVGSLTYYSDAALSIPVSVPTSVSTGTYYIEASNGICSANGSLTVTVNTTPSLTLNDQTVCAPNTVDLTDPSIVSTTAGTLAYYTDLTLTTPFSTPSSAGAGTYYVEATNVNCSFSGNILVTVNATPTLSLSSQSLCAPATVDLTSSAIASTDIGVLSYYSDAAYSTIVSNPTAVGTGVYYVEAISNGCSANGSLTVAINTIPSLTLNDQTICAPATVDLTDPTVSSTDVGILAYYTDPAMTISVATPTAVGTGTYYVESTNNNCAFSGIVEVIIANIPVITPNTPIVGCGSVVLPAITGTDIINEGYWTGSNQTGTLYSVGDVVSTSGTLYMFAGLSGCSDQESTQITIQVLPTVASVTSGGTYCQGDAVNNVLANVSGTGPWTVDYTVDGVTQSATGSSSPVSLGNAPGVYVVTNLSDANCPNGANGSQTITVNPLPNSPLTSADTTYCSTWTIQQMTAAGNGGVFTWYSDATLTNQLATGATLLPGSNEGVATYYVTETLLGCEGPSSPIVVSIEFCEIVIPSAFTPNGDQVNDLWNILELDNVYPNNLVQVFNRWGEKIYESDKGDYLGRPWDGFYNNTKLPVASYFYILDLGDGSDKRNGTVSIIQK
jgi:gliding motility-associated-like protein